MFTQHYIKIHNVLNKFYAWPNSMQTFAKQFVNIASEVCFKKNVKLKKKMFKCKLSSAVNNKFS